MPYIATVQGDREMSFTLHIGKDTPRSEIVRQVATKVMMYTGDSFKTSKYAADTADIKWVDDGDDQTTRTPSKPSQNTFNFGEDFVNPEYEDKTAIEIVEDALADSKLSTAERNKIPSGKFALPGRRYPVNDLAHARNALARVSQHGTPSEKKRVRSFVYAEYPSLKKKGKDSSNN